MGNYSRLLATVILLVSIGSQDIVGQDLSLQRPSFSQLTGDNALSSLGKRFGLTPGAVALPLILEGAVNPSEYVVGPGDQFLVSMGGMITEQLPVIVAVDGQLTIPDIYDGIVAGRLLHDVQTEVMAALRDNFRNVDVGFSLTAPRSFYIHVTGSVPEPGRFVANAVSRLDDALQLAFARKAFDLERLRGGGANLDPDEFARMIPSTTSERPLISQSYRPSLRAVTITRANGSVLSVDLMKYYSIGDVAENPFVQDGDIVRVPPYHVMDAVNVVGDIPYPGAYPFRTGDRLSDLLEIASGSTDISGIGEVRVTERHSDGTATSFSLHTADIQTDGPNDRSISAGALINVSAMVQETAAVYGTVEFPGTYPIKANGTTLKELIEMAGGLTEDANLEAAYVERRRSDLLKSDGRQSDLDFFGRTYLAIERRRNRVAVDVQRNMSGEETFLMRGGDTVIFPPGEESVFVTGNVAQGGYVPYVEGETAQYYIDQAGGAGPETTGVYIFELSTGQYREGGGTIVKEGDTIFVNRVPITDSPELQSLLITAETSRRQIKLATVQTVITGISAIAAVVTTVVAITR
ncbi:MAG: sugar transporter [Rhodothermales bacterium]|nr:sugar transporter [Rhodothermales bacterium]